jgi:hypothetical protein
MFTNTMSEHTRAKRLSISTNLPTLIVATNVRHDRVKMIPMFVSRFFSLYSSFWVIHVAPNPSHSAFACFWVLINKAFAPGHRHADVGLGPLVDESKSLPFSTLPVHDALSGSRCNVFLRSAAPPLLRISRSWATRGSKGICPSKHGVAAVEAAVELEATVHPRDLLLHSNIPFRVPPKLFFITSDNLRRLFRVFFQ